MTQNPQKNFSEGFYLPIFDGIKRKILWKFKEN